MTRRRRTSSKDAAIVDERERHPERSLSSLFAKHHRDPDAFKRSVGVRRVGRRLQLPPRHERRLDRDPIPIVAEVGGRLTVVRVRTPNDSQYYAAKEQDSAIFAAVLKDDDSRLGRHAGRVMVDADTGLRYRIAGDGDAIRDAVDTGEIELQELYYSGGSSADVEALLGTGGGP